MIKNFSTSILVDSGSSISLVSEDIVRICSLHIEHTDAIIMQTASCDTFKLSSFVLLPIKIGRFDVIHKALVCKHMVSPVILGTDFMSLYGIIVNFESKVITASGYGLIWSNNDISPLANKTPCCPIHTNESLWENTFTVSAIVPDSDEAEDCAIPMFHKQPIYTRPNCSTQFEDIVTQYQELFSSLPGHTNTIKHHIPTGDATPIRVPPRRIPQNYRQEVERQINEMLRQGIIIESTSPWMAPCVYVPKKNGELRICVDYRELNKRTAKNSYPLPLPDEVQDRIGNAQVYSKFDCRKGFWQVPVAAEDRHKTAFSPGPGFGLFEFCQLPFGLSGSPGTFHLLMDQVLRGLSFVMVYVDDILVFSPSVSMHRKHLQAVFECLKNNGLTLHAEKCLRRSPIWAIPSVAKGYSQTS